MSFNKKVGKATEKVKYFVRKKLECFIYYVSTQKDCLALFFVERFFAIWLVKVIHGYKDGVLLALKLFWNIFNFSFQVKVFQVLLCLLPKVILNLQNKNLNKYVEICEICVKFIRETINFLLFREVKLIKLTRETIHFLLESGVGAYGIRKCKGKTDWCYQR